MNFLTLSTLSLSLFILPVSAQTVQFNIEGIQHDKGKLYIQLFKGENNFKKGEAHNVAIVNAKKGKLTVTFNDVEPGDYAIRYFHDENSNRDFDNNMFGMPIEGYGFSNNAPVNFGPPSYQQMTFMVSDVAVINSSTVNY
ncbi:DUF2141 domain-containing protein [Pseudoalteromonas spongiae]|uniref:DUF2141 domain-containing protein n=1 Tax=Pseudoalteromonas spongiae TaxID=298657 RepID=UPI00026CA90C|nr:DUF2141 domain-containing protein [Pseudoalteromonas spongiae]ATD01432.1 hypothetical protein PSPO_b1604 [Pseudoalteromonas spongiae UST010723-006]